LHQWYWSYQYPDFLDSNNEFIDFDSYIANVLSSNSSIVENGRIPISNLLNKDVTVTPVDVITEKATIQLNTPSNMKHAYNSQLWDINARFTIDENRELCQRLSDYKLNQQPNLNLRVYQPIRGEPKVCRIFGTFFGTGAVRMNGFFLDAIRK
jgi:hypothetical protein